jgi:hypothetical protein
MKLDSSVVERAVFLDFEGNTDRLPTFAGVLYDDHFEQVIFEDTFNPVLESYEPRQHSAPRDYSPRLPHPSRTAMGKSTLEAFTRQLVRQCQQQQRRIVAWSQHEKEVLIAAEPNLAEAIEGLYVDAKDRAKDWKRRFHHNVRFMRTPRGGAHKLKAYFALIGYTRETYFGEQQAGQRIAFVRQQLRRRGEYQAITSTGKAKWTKVLDYNWHDCYGLRELTVTVAGDLALVSDERRHAA